MAGQGDLLQVSGRGVATDQSENAGFGRGAAVQIVSPPFDHCLISATSRALWRITAGSQIFPTYGIMYGVKRTTIYLPEDLKGALARAAHEEGRTEADLIREGIETFLRSRDPEPRVPLFTSGIPDLAENVDKLLAGFGEG